jgi:hypothetical protein
MKTYTKRIVCFADILGFSELIKSASDPVSGGAIIKTIEEALNGDLISPIRNSVGSSKKKSSIKLFSDCISISADDSFSGLLLLVAQLASAQNRLIRKSILIRGAISSGLHYESRSMIFSAGLVSAYKMETSQAIYPRIIVEEELIERHFRTGNENTIEAKKKLASVWLARDSDRQYFIAYNPGIIFQGDAAVKAKNRYAQQRDALKKLIHSQAKSPAALNKLAWAQRYHDYSCQKHFPAEPALRIVPPNVAEFQSGI